MSKFLRLAGLTILAVCVAAPVAADDAPQNPAEAYAQFHKSLRHSLSERTVLPYFTARALAEFEQKFPPQFRGKAVYLMKTASPRQYQVVNSKIDGDSAALTLQASDSGKVLAGTVDLKKEDGVWKVDQVIWQGR